MLINTDNFDLTGRIGSGVFSGGAGSNVPENTAQTPAKTKRTDDPCFLIFVEIYDLDARLIINYPVETSRQRELAHRINKQALFYARLLENVYVRAAAIETPQINTLEWAAFESLIAPEEIIVEALRRVQTNAGKEKQPANEPISYLELLDAESAACHGNGDNNIITAAAVRKKTPLPALNESPSRYDITSYPLIVCAQANPPGLEEYSKTKLKGRKT